jgi:TolB-like protein
MTMHMGKWGRWCTANLLLALLCLSSVQAANTSNVVRRVAIAPLRVVDSQLDSKAMRQAFADLLAASLGRHDGIQVVEREELNKIVDEKTLSLLNKGDAGLKVSLAGADYLCVGAYERQTNRVIISIRLIDSVSSSVAGVFRSGGDWNDLDLITRQLAKEIASKVLGSQSVSVLKATDRSPRASARFLHGLALVGQGEHAAAITEFMAARSIDTEMTDVVLPLGKSFMELGLYADALLEFSRYLKDLPNGPDAKEMATLKTVCETKVTTDQRDLVRHILTLRLDTRKEVKK